MTTRWKNVVAVVSIWHFLVCSLSPTAGFVGVRRFDAVAPPSAVRHARVVHARVVHARVVHARVVQDRRRTSISLLASREGKDASLNESEKWNHDVKERTRRKIEKQNLANGGVQVEWDDDNTWTPFIVEVAEFLKSSDYSKRVIVPMLASLITYGVKTQDTLKGAAGIPPTKETFRQTLKAKGVGDWVFPVLFHRFVVSTANNAALDSGMFALLDTCR